MRDLVTILTTCAICINTSPLPSLPSPLSPSSPSYPGCRAAADDDDDVEDSGTVAEDLGAHADALRTDGESVER